MLVWIILAVVLMIAGVLLLGAEGGLMMGLSPGEIASLGFLIVILATGIPYILQLYQGRFGQAARHALIWAGIVLALFVGYAFRGELSVVASRVGNELTPAGTALSTAGETAGEQTVRLRRRDDGHFAARAQINGETVAMMIDTGASSIVLRPVDAERVGIDLSSLTYSVPVSTANGMAFAAPVLLSRFAVGPLELRNLRALVAKPGVLDESLLGMSFLSKLRSYEFSGEFLTLRG
jgi:aspartyl protease family protein